MPTYTAQTDRPLGPQILDVKPNDTIILPDATWAGNLSLTPPEAVTIVAAPGAMPTVVGLVRIGNARGVVFDGLHVRWPNGGSASEHMLKFTGGVGWKFLNGSALGAQHKITRAPCPAAFFNPATACGSLRCAGSIPISTVRAGACASETIPLM